MTGVDTLKITERLISRVAALFIDTWLVMILCGMVHSTWHAFPAFGYWGCLFGVWVSRHVVGSNLLPISFRLEDTSK